QRTVLYLGEINDGQEATWRKTLQVFDESQQQHTTLSLFPEDREIPAESSDSIQVKLSAMELRRPRAFGNCWLGCELWRQLHLEEFWEAKLAEKVKRETVSELGEGAAAAGGESIARSGERISSASAVVRSKCDGGVVGSRLCG